MTTGNAVPVTAGSQARRCAFLTMDNAEGWSIDADPGIAPLEAAFDRYVTAAMGILCPRQ